MTTNRLRALVIALVLAALVAVLAIAAAAANRDREQPQAADGYVGLTVEDAGDRADANGLPWRVVEIDGVPQAVTEDFVPNRLNFVVADGIVTAYSTDAELTPGVHDPGTTQSFVGLDVETAGNQALAADRPWRVVSVDGEDLVITADFQADRVNFVVVDGIVVEALTDAQLNTTD